MGDSLVSAGRRNRLGGADNNIRQSKPFVRRAALLAAAAALVGLRPASAIVIRDDTSDSLYQALSAQPQYAGPSGFIDGVTGTSGSNTFYNFGTATLIAPDRILNAA